LGFLPHPVFIERKNVYVEFVENLVHFKSENSEKIIQYERSYEMALEGVFFLTVK